MPGVGFGTRELVLQYVHRAGQGRLQGVGDLGRAVRAVVDQQQDLRAVVALLQSQRAQAIRDERRFVTDWYGDDDLPHV